MIGPLIGLDIVDPTVAGPAAAVALVGIGAALLIAYVRDRKR